MSRFFSEKIAGKTLPQGFLLAAFLIGWLAPASLWAGEGDTGASMLELGIQAYQHKNYEQAQKYLEEAARKNKSIAPEARLYLGRALIQQRQWTPALKEILKAKELGLSDRSQTIADASIAYIITYGNVSTVAEKKEPSVAVRRETPVRKQPWQKAAQKPWSIYLSGSAEYVDGIAPPLTATTALSPFRQDDFRTRLGLGGNYRFKVGKKGSINAGYDFSQTLYSDFDEYNLQGHSFSGRYSRPLNKDISLSASYGFTHYTLDGDDYLGTHRVGLSGFFHETGSFYGRLNYGFQNDEFDLNPGQDRDLHSINLTQYWFFPNKKDYLSGGYGYTNADATLSRWDYDSHRVFGGGKYDPMPKHTLTGLLSYTSYEYDGFDTLETTKIRDDDVISFKARWNYNFLDWMDVFLKYSVTDTDSNIIRQDYLGQVLSFGTTLTW